MCLHVLFHASPYLPLFICLPCFVCMSLCLSVSLCLPYSSCPPPYMSVSARLHDSLPLYMHVSVRRIRLSALPNVFATTSVCRKLFSWRPFSVQLGCTLSTVSPSSHTPLRRASIPAPFHSTAPQCAAPVDSTPPTSASSDLRPTHFMSSSRKFFT